MSRMIFKRQLFLAVLIAEVFCSGVVLAEKPDWADRDGGKSNHGEKHGRYDVRGDDRDDSRQRDYNDRGDSVSISIHIGDRERTVVHDYYREHYSAGHCPPGLAKKHNGCMPPGLAKKWRVGHPLPRDVVFHELPPHLVVQLGTPPPRHRYVRVAADILLIAIGTGMVVDAIEDLGNM